MKIRTLILFATTATLSINFAFAQADDSTLPIKNNGQHQGVKRDSAQFDRTKVDMNQGTVSPVTPQKSDTVIKNKNIHEGQNSISVDSSRLNSKPASIPKTSTAPVAPVKSPPQAKPATQVKQGTVRSTEDSTAKKKMYLVPDSAVKKNK